MFAMHQFYGLPVDVPKHLEQEVSEDNMKFLYETLVYNKDFVTFFCEFNLNARIALECMMGPAEKKDAFRSSLCGIGERYMFDILPHVKIAEMYNLSHCGEGLSKLFGNNLGGEPEVVEEVCGRPVPVV